NTRIGVASVAATPFDGWQALVVRGLAPAGATQASVLVYSSVANVGVAHADDVSVVEVASDGLTVPNGDFELVSGATPALWAQMNPAVPYTSDAGHVRSGESAVRHAHESWTTK